MKFSIFFIFIFVELYGGYVEESIPNFDNHRRLDGMGNQVSSQPNIHLNDRYLQNSMESKDIDKNIVNAQKSGHFFLLKPLGPRSLKVSDDTTTYNDSYIDP